MGTIIDLMGDSETIGPDISRLRELNNSLDSLDCALDSFKNTESRPRWEIFTSWAYLFK